MLFLTGDDSKSIFPKAMKLLLPDRVVQLPDDVPKTKIEYSMRRGDLRRVKEFPPTLAENEKWERSLRQAWLIAVEGSPSFTLHEATQMGVHQVVRPRKQRDRKVPRHHLAARVHPLPDRTRYS